MEVSFIKFSRPLLIQCCETEYQTIYGFVVNQHLDEGVLSDIHGYCGYLSALHELSNGSSLFSVDAENGLPYWIDKKGEMHQKVDSWMEKIYNKCRKKLNLTYSITTLDVDEEYDYSHCLNKYGLISCGSFFYELGRCLEERNPHVLFVKGV